MNANRKWLLAIIVVAMIAGVLGYTLGHRSTDKPSVAQERAEVSDSGRKVLYWHDPMVPGAKFDKPGKSPFMDMQLVPVYADENADSGVRVQPNIAQNLGIRLGKVERRTVLPNVTAVGSVAFDERLVEVVQSRVAGSVARLYVKAPLVTVRRGQRLAEIVAPEWLTAQQDYLALLDAPAAAEPIRQAARERLVVLGVPDEIIRALEKDRKTYPTTTVFAPSDGIVTELTVREGSTFAAGAPLARINGLSSVWVNAQIPEAQVSLVASDTDIDVHAKAWPGETFKGRVVALLPDVDPQTRTLTARIEVGNRQQRLAPGMFVSLTLAGSPAQAQLAVPSEAVITTGTRSVVIVRREDGAFDVATVTTGTDAAGFTTILSGLEEGQTIVLSGQFLLDSEASLRATVDRLSAPSEAEQKDRP
jgi:Cu(I)/Ag(I) efflux system membrane fusion protein